MTSFSLQWFLIILFFFCFSFLSSCVTSDGHTALLSARTGSPSCTPPTTRCSRQRRAHTCMHARAAQPPTVPSHDNYDIMSLRVTWSMHSTNQLPPQIFFFFFLNVIVDEHQINDDGECKWRDHAHPEVTFKHVVEQPRLFSKKNNQ